MELHKDRNFLNEKYVVEGLSSKEVGTLCKVDQKTVLYWLAKFNLPIRSLQEGRKEWFKHHPHPMLGTGIGKKAIDKKSYQKHREKRLIKMKEYRQEHRGEIMAINKEYYQKNKEKIREQSRQYNRNLRMEILCHYGGDPPKCACCNESYYEFLAIDHINGGGYKHRKKLGPSGGSMLYYWLKKNNYPGGFRVLCHNCNVSLGLYGYCPHTKEVTQ